MKPSVRAGFCGVAAAAVALGVAELVAVLTGPLSAPLLAVGGVVVDNVPGPVKDFGVQVFGTHDKTALITGTAVLLAAYAFGVGVLARRHWPPALAGIALFGLVGAAAAMTRHHAGALAALPSLVGAGLAVPVLRHLLGLAEQAAGAGGAEVGAAPSGVARFGVGQPAAGAETAQPAAAEVGAVQSAVAPVGIAQPAAVRPDAARPGAARLDSDLAAAVQPDAARPGAARLDSDLAATGRPGGAPAAEPEVGETPVEQNDAGTENRRAVGSRAGAGPGGGTVPGVRLPGPPARADGPDRDGGKTAAAGRGRAVGDGDDAYVLGSRRRFLKAVGVAAGVAAVSGLAGRFLTARQAVTRARAEVSLPVPVEPVPTLPAGVQAPGASPYVSSNSSFYRIDTALYPPQVDPSTWQLTIHGMVRNPITITWEQLLRRPMIARYITLTCVSNEVGGDLIGNALWLGTPIKALLDEADPLPGADQVVQRSVDGWTCGTPTAALRDGRDALLAVGMNGRPLPIEHGFPVRMVVPGLYGYVSACKWITEIELSRFQDFDAYWVPRGWSQQAPIKTESRIDTPRDGASRPAGTVVVAGVAWAQHRGISKVEVQVDNGPWAEATLAATVSSDTWREWSYQWAATRGKHVLRVRATDTTGVTQTGELADPAPNGASGWHTVQIKVD